MSEERAMMDQLVVTARAAGKGADPKMVAEYQLAACSEGVSQAVRDHVLRRGPSLAQLLRQEGLSADGLARERQWRQAGNEATPTPVPEEIRGSFPVVWDYSACPDGRFALTRVCYLGKQPYPPYRLGNYLAHALVFAPEALAGCDYNPMCLRQTSVFWTEDRGTVTRLDSIDPSALPMVRDARPSQRLGQAPYSGQLERLCVALAEASGGGRSLLLAIPGNEDTTNLIEELLAMLPGPARARTTYCSHYMGGAILAPPRSAAGRPEAASGPMLAIVQGQQSIESLKLTDMDFRPEATRLVFSFVANRFAAGLTPGGYATLVGNAVRTGDAKPLQSYQNQLRQLTAGVIPAQWDALLGVRPLLDPNPRLEDLLSALRCAAGPGTGTPSAAEAVVSWMLPHLRRLVQAGNPDAFRPFTDLVRVIDRVAKDEALNPPLQELLELCVEQVRRGRSDIAQALLGLTGTWRKRMVADLVLSVAQQAGAQRQAPASADSTAALNELLIDGLQALVAVKEWRDAFRCVLKFVIDPDSGMGLGDRLWGALETAVLEPYFTGTWEPGDRQVIERLAVRNGRFADLLRRRDVLDALHLLTRSNAWREGAAGAALLDGRPAARALADAVAALRKLAGGNAVDGWLLDRLAPHLDRLADESDWSGLDLLRDAVISLMQAMRAPAGNQGRPTVADRMAKAGEKAFMSGRARTASSLLGYCPSHRAGLLKIWIETGLQRPKPHFGNPPDPDDARALIDLLQGALVAAAGNGRTLAEACDPWLVELFNVAGRAKCCAYAWEKSGELVKRVAAGGEPGSRSERLRRQLQEAVKNGDSPDAIFWLGLQSVGLQSGWQNKLVDLAGPASGTRDPVASAKELCRSVDQEDSPEQRVALLGRIIAASFGVCQDHFVRPYLENLKTLQPDQQEKVRRTLAGLNLAEPLGRELIGLVLPWQDPESGQTLQRWQGGLLSKVILKDGLCACVARRVAAEGLAIDPALRLPWELMVTPLAGAKSSPEMAELCRAVLNALPVAPLAGAWVDKLSAHAGSLAESDRARLETMLFLKEVEDRAGQADWSIGAFPRADARWSGWVLKLPEPVRVEVLDWCLGTMTRTGISMPADVQALFRLLEDMQVFRPTSVVRACEQLMDGCSTVARIQALTALADFAIKGADTAVTQVCTEAFRALTGKLERDPRRLLDEHFVYDRRFCARAPDYGERHLRFCREAGLSVPEAPPSPRQLRPETGAEVRVARAQPRAERPTKPEAADARSGERDPVIDQDGKKGLFSGVMRLFGKDRDE